MPKKRQEKAELTQEKFVRSDTGEAEVPPVIVKGGSLDVEYPRIPFQDPVNETDVVLTIGPLASEVEGGVGEIQLVEFRHKETKDVIAFMRRPANLPHRECLVVIWDDQ